MQTQNQLKEMVRRKYSEVALKHKISDHESCCGPGCCTSESYSITDDDYRALDGYNADADLGLGCGLPTQFAKIKKGDVVVDLGSGAGNDCLVARAETGETGKVIGIDFTEAMINKAREHAEKLGFQNVEFRMGDIERMPLTSGAADVVVSNCVLNLVPDKDAVFKEIYRVLKPGGHFSISDVVLVGDLPDSLKKDAEMYAGCVAGAIQKDVYIELIKLNGFKNIVVQKEKMINIPNDILANYLDDEELQNFKSGSTGIFSITVYAEKAKDETSCCGSECCN